MPLSGELPLRPSSPWALRERGASSEVHRVLLHSWVCAAEVKNEAVSPHWKRSRMRTSHAPTLTKRGIKPYCELCGSRTPIRCGQLIHLDRCKFATVQGKRTQTGCGYCADWPDVGNKSCGLLVFAGGGRSWICTHRPPGRSGFQ